MFDFKNNKKKETQIIVVMYIKIKSKKGRVVLS